MLEFLQKKTLRRSALVAREIAKLDIDMAVLSEVCYPEQGSLTEHEVLQTLWSWPYDQELH